MDDLSLPVLHWPCLRIVDTCHFSGAASWALLTRHCYLLAKTFTWLTGKFCRKTGDEPKLGLKRFKQRLLFAPSLHEEASTEVAIEGARGCFRFAFRHECSRTLTLVMENELSLIAPASRWHLVQRLGGRRVQGSCASVTWETEEFPLCRYTPALLPSLTLRARPCFSVSLP